jgi:hypothetical protein
VVKPYELGFTKRVEGGRRSGDRPIFKRKTEEFCERTSTPRPPKPAEEPLPGYEEKVSFFLCLVLARVALHRVKPWPGE